MRRAWQIPQDQELELRGGRTVAVVSHAALAESLLEAATLLHRAGGTLSVVLMRQPTDLPGEMVTIGAIVEWKDRTDARPQPEQPALEGNGMPDFPEEIVVQPIEEADPELEADESSIPSALR